MPIIFETSLQARFVIPMAVSLGFAVLFATLITLVLVPALYIILTDVQGAGSRLKAKIRRKPKSDDNQLEKAEA
jgi:Cu/Ag efflux pump CusA